MLEEYTIRFDRHITVYWKIKDKRKACIHSIIANHQVHDDIWYDILYPKGIPLKQTPTANCQLPAYNIDVLYINRFDVSLKIFLFNKPCTRGIMDYNQNLKIAKHPGLLFGDQYLLFWLALLWDERLLSDGTESPSQLTTCWLCCAAATWANSETLHTFTDLSRLPL